LTPSAFLCTFPAFNRVVSVLGGGDSRDAPCQHRQGSGNMGPRSVCRGLARRVGDALWQQILLRGGALRHSWFTRHGRRGSPRGRNTRIESLEERAMLSADEGWSLVTLAGMAPGDSRAAIVLWRDYDGDGRTDLLVAGEGAHGQETVLYHNEGDALIDSGLALPGLTQGCGDLWGRQRRRPVRSFSCGARRAGGDAVAALPRQCGGAIHAQRALASRSGRRRAAQPRLRPRRRR
jgi:hypothetical protein